MVNHQAHKQVQGGIYDFAIDGGAIGVIQSRVHIPKFCLLTGFWVMPIVTGTSGGAATVSFGTITTDLLAPVSAPVALMAATAIATFTAGSAIRGVDLDATPIKLANFIDITMSIAAFALTAGRFQFLIEYTEQIL